MRGHQVRSRGLTEALMRRNASEANVEGGVISCGFRRGEGVAPPPFPSSPAGVISHLLRRHQSQT